MGMEILLLGAALLLAFVNGANDNLKGVATLYGAGRARYGSALAVATISTAAGALACVVIATGLVRAFSGKGLLPPELLDAPLLASVAGAAAFTVLIATRVGMPISTTHAIVGGLAGAGAVAAGSAMNFAALGKAFLLPLAVGPLLAIALAWFFSRGGGVLGRRLGIDASSCVCVDEVVGAGAAVPSGGATAMSSLALPLRAEVAHRDDCGARNAHALRVDVDSALEASHWVSASAVGFARGLNDTPKILGLLVGASAIEPVTGALWIAAAMSLGGILAARRVAETLAHRITPMTNAQGLAGNLATSLLVMSASRLALPVSTTHVSTGGIFGIGASGGTLHRSTTSQILGAWLGTLPLAAALGALLVTVLR